MKKKNFQCNTRSTVSKKEFIDKASPVLPSDSPGGWIRLNPFFSNFVFSPIEIMFPGSEPRSFYGMPGESYLTGEANGKPWRLIDAINDENKIVLRINLNHKRERIKEDFERLFSIIRKGLKKHGRKTFKISNREFDLYQKIYDLRQENPKEWTFLRIAQKIFPRDFNTELKDGANVDSAVKKVTRFYKEAKRLIEGT
jgi:hypothetical protein